VLDGFRGERSVAELCRREGIAESLYYNWSKEFLEAASGGWREIPHGLRPAARSGICGRKPRRLMKPSPSRLCEVKAFPNQKSLGVTGSVQGLLDRVGLCFFMLHPNYSSG
jgi:transposase-like protein